MATNDNQDQDLSILEDATELTVDDLTADTSKMQTVLAQKKHWRDKAVDTQTGKTFKELYEASIANQHPVPSQPIKKPELPESVLSDIASLKEAESKRQFQYAHDLTPTEVDNVFAWATAKKIKPEDALNDSFFKGALTAERNAQGSSNAVPSPSRRSPSVIGQKSFKDMTPEERRTSFNR